MNSQFFNHLLAEHKWPVRKASNEDSSPSLTADIWDHFGQLL